MMRTIKLFSRLFRVIGRLGILGLLIAATASIPTQARPFAYVANSNGQSVSVIDVATN